MATNEGNRIICFDLDGTLADSSQAHAVSFNLAFKKNKLREFPEAKIISLMGPPAEVLVKKLFPKLSSAKLKAVVKDKRRIFAIKTLKLVKKIPDLPIVLKELKKDFKLAILTNSTRPEAKTILAQVGINQKFFSAILTAPQIHNKPDAHLIDILEDKVCGKVDWIVGDTTYDIKLGNNAGVRTIAVLSGVHDEETLMKEEPTMLLESVSYLLRFKGDLKSTK